MHIALLGIPIRQDQIKVFSAGGVDRDFGLLAKYAVTPELGEAISNGYILTRPPTRYLVVVDPARAFITQEKREEKRRAWVQDIWDSISRDERKHIPKSEIDPLVEVKTWNTKGESFEFAHFTNHQLAMTILKVYKGPNTFSSADVEAQIDIIRKHAGNLEHLWKRWKGIKPTKVRLADALWVILEKRINRAISKNTDHKIPVVRVVSHAYKRATQTHRDSVVIRSKKQ